MITILSPNGLYRAAVADHDDGVHVLIRRAVYGRHGIAAVSTGVFDVVFHVAVNQVAGVLSRLENEDDNCP